MKRPNLQKGQTLIETLAAVFVLAMGITAVVGLASYSLSSATNVIKQVVGIGLARQGVEAVKNMRDTNWLRQAGSISTDCYNFKNQLFTDSCFRNWIDNASAYNIATDCGASPCVLSFDPETTGPVFPEAPNDYKFWRLSAPNVQYGYSLAVNTLASNTKYFYYPATSAADKQSGYYRSVTVVQEPGPAPFDSDTSYPVLRVISRVWWADKKCPTPSAFSYPTSGSCRITLETILTNWKTN